MAEQQEAPQLSPEEALAAEYDVGDRGETPPIQPETSSDIPPSPTGEPAPPSAPTHPRWLLNMALDQGFSDDEIREIPTDQLGEMVHRIHANVRRVSEQRQQAEGVEQSRRPQQQFQQQPQREPTIEDEIDLGDPERDGFTPEMVSLLKKATAIPLARVKQLEAQLAQLMQYQQNKEAEARFQLIDRVIEGFGPKYVKHFGKGNGQQVKAKDPQAFQKRIKLVKIAAAMTDEHGGLEPAMHEAKLLFPIDQESPQPQESDVPQAPAQTPQQAWNQGGIARPTQRQPVHEPPGRERAIKNVTRTLAAQGIGNGEGSSNENGKATRDDFLD